MISSSLRSRQVSPTSKASQCARESASNSNSLKSASEDKHLAFLKNASKEVDIAFEGPWQGEVTSRGESQDESVEPWLEGESLVLLSLKLLMLSLLVLLISMMFCCMLLAMLSDAGGIEPPPPDAGPASCSVADADASMFGAVVATAVSEKVVSKLVVW